MNARDDDMFTMQDAKEISKQDEAQIEDFFQSGKFKFGPMDSEEPDFSAIKEKKIGGGRKLGDLTLMKQNDQIDLRKPISIEKQRNFERNENTTVVIQHKDSE